MKNDGEPLLSSANGSLSSSDPVTQSAVSRNRVILAVFLVVINQIGNVGSGELMQYQETHGAQPFDNPYFSIWFNHSVTGLSLPLAGIF